MLLTSYLHDWFFSICHFDNAHFIEVLLEHFEEMKLRLAIVYVKIKFLLSKLTAVNFLNYKNKQLVKFTHKNS